MSTKIRISDEASKDVIPAPILELELANKEGPR